MEEKKKKEIPMLTGRDRLTHLYNREYFMEKTKKMLREHSEVLFVLVRMDVDHFRLFNASFGTKAGDELLKKLADSIHKNRVEMETYGRIESDVFCVCAPYHKEELEKVLEGADQNLQNLSVNYRLKLSFGIYVIWNREEEMEKMYSCATEAARQCKKDIRTSYMYYTEEMSIREQKMMQIVRDMDNAIRERQFHVFLQPKYSLETNSPCGAEALVRWVHPQRGMIFPAEFIPVFEQNGQIMELDFYMWEQVCILLHRWLEEGEDPYPISVNVSRVSLHNPNIVKQLLELTRIYQVPKYLLNLEITESAYMSNPDLMKNVIFQLRQEGFVILMDDFGSGYSSLNTLKDIDVDILKIDMKFLPAGANNVKSEKILASVARMAGWLGMPVVVEGVETKEQKDFLEGMGCSYVQGFYFARPMPAQEYEVLIKCQDRLEDAELYLPSSLNLTEDMDAIWSADSRAVSLLKSVSIPFAILEYVDKQLDILRRNQAYTDEFGSGAQLKEQLGHQELKKLQEALDNAEYTRDYAECECLYIMVDGSCRWYRIRLLYIGSSPKTCLIGATFSNVTAERMLEKELNSIFGILKEKSQKKASLLIVDDVEVSRELLRLVFESEFDIIMAADGQEALQKLEENSDKIAAILLDMMMPNMNGQEFLAYKNKMPCAAEIPVIVISAQDDENVQVAMLENGVNDYVTKPFVSALVHQRVHNVLEYSRRFQRLVLEYPKRSSEEKKVVFSSYTIEQIGNLMRFMSEIFNLVRLVDPEDTAIVSLNVEETFQKSPHSCFRVWGKDTRCENCSCLAAKQTRCILSRYERVQNKIFYVVSRPVTIWISERKTEEFILEIASEISNETTLEMLNDISLGHTMEQTQEMLYTDSLTSAYNRRYFDDMIFLHHGQTGIAKKICFIMLDLNRFKQINDLFGHQAGDLVLKGVVKALKEQIRQQDSVIRFGGDEFIVVLTNCERSQIENAVKRLENAVRSVRYGPNHTMEAQADFGYAYTDHFVKEGNMLSEMLKEADDMMYANKRKKKKQEKE